MERHLKYILLAISWLVGTRGFAQQEYISAVLPDQLSLVNPARAGVDSVSRLQCALRQQWVGVEGAPSRGIISYRQGQTTSRFGFGIQAVQDRVGVFQRSALSLDMAYHLRTGSGQWSVGFRLTAGRVHQNLSSLRMTDSGDPQFEGIQQRFNYLNQGFGLHWSHSRWKFDAVTPGIRQISARQLAGENVVTPRISTSDMPILASFGVHSISDSKWQKAISTGGFRDISSEAFWFLAGSVKYQNVIGLGAQYVHGNSIALHVTMTINKQLDLVLAGEQSISDIAVPGSAELRLCWRIARQTPKI